MTKYKNIFLIGFMGAGKTSVGKMVAKELGFRFSDLDELVEKKLGMTIPEIFSKFGEAFFRDAESEMLRTVAQGKRQVIATGGGVILSEDNREAMRKGGITIYLRAPVEVLWSRVKDNTSRPLLQVENPYQRLVELFSLRTSLYERADLTVDTENISPHNVAKDLVKKLKRL